MATEFDAVHASSRWKLCGIRPIVPSCRRCRALPEAIPRWGRCWWPRRLRVGFWAVGVAMLWRSLHVEMGMCTCVGSVNLCRKRRREVLDKRSHAMFEPFSARLGDWCVRVRVIGEGFASQSRVPSYAPETIWASHRGGGWGTLRDRPDSACIRGAVGVFKMERGRRGLC
jgi:hypothetical protein